MSDVSPLLQNIQSLSVQFNSGVSEFLLQSLSGSQNFLNYFTYSEKRFTLFGPYSIVADPQTAVDGLQVFEFDCQIIDVWMFNMTAGASGTTELDVKMATTSGGTFNSIFTTTPKIAFNAGNNCWVGSPNPSLIGPQYSPSPSYSAPAHTTQPVLNASITNVIPRWSAIRLDKISSQVGGQDCGLVIQYRNINTL